MCLPIGFLRCYTITGAVVTLLAGLGFLVISIIGFLHSDIWINDTSSTKNAIMIGVLLIDVLIILTSIIGIFGIVKGRPGLICVFTMLVGLFCLAMAGMGIFAMVGPGEMLPSDCRNNNVSWVQDISKLYSVSGMLCNEGCPCNFSSFGNLDLPLQAQILSHYSMLNGPDFQLQTCKTFQYFVSDIPNIRTVMDSLGAIEQYLECTGWCDGVDYPGQDLVYKFSDVNNQPQPSGYCFRKLHDWMVKWSELIEYSCFGLAGALGLVFLCNMCICCHPDRRSKKIAERFFEPRRHRGHQYHGGI